MKRHISSLLLAGVLLGPSAALAQMGYPATGMESVPAGPAFSPGPPVSNPPPPDQSAWPPRTMPPAGNSPAGYSTPSPPVPSPPPPEQPGWPAAPPAAAPALPPSASSSPPSSSLLPPGEPVFQPDAPAPLTGTQTLGSLAGQCGPRWDISFDALWLTRSDDRGVHLGWTDYNPNATGPGTVYPDDLWSDDALFPLAPGVRMQLVGQVTDWISVETTAWGLQQWSVGRTIFGDPNNYTVLAYSPWLQLPKLINDGMDNYLGYTDRSEVANVELNQRFRLYPYDPFRSLSLLWGVRYFYLSDDFTLSGSDLYNAANEDLEWQTKNNLIGLQVGVQAGRTWDRFDLSFEAKIGLFANVYSQHGTDTGVAPGFLPSDGSHSGTDLGTLAEVSVLARYRVADSVWVRAGYQFYGVSGLALGARQLADYDARGTIGLDGLSVGLEVAR